jgi:hypothetical protein
MIKLKCIERVNSKTFYFEEDILKHAEENLSWREQNRTQLNIQCMTEKMMVEIISGLFVKLKK